MVNRGMGICFLETNRLIYIFRCYWILLSPTQLIFTNETAKKLIFAISFPLVEGYQLPKDRYISYPIESYPKIDTSVIQ